MWNALKMPEKTGPRPPPDQQGPLHIHVSTEAPEEQTLTQARIPSQWRQSEMILGQKASPLGRPSDSPEKLRKRGPRHRGHLGLPLWQCRMLSQSRNL